MKKISSLCVLSLALASISALGGFSGTVVVLQFPTSASHSGSAGTLVEYDSAGSQTFSVSLPNNGTTDTGSSIMFCDNSGFSHGLNLSYDGAFVVIPGFANAVASGILDSAAGTAAPRVVGLVKYDGTYTRGLTCVANTFSTVGFRYAASDGCGNFWGIGNGAGGTKYLNTDTTVQSTTGRSIRIANGNLHYNAGTAVNSLPGLPQTASSPTLIITPAGTSASSGNFALPENPVSGSRAYVANTSGSLVGVQRFDWSGSAWVYQYTITLLSSEIPQHLTVDYSGASPVIYAVNTSGAHLQKITDVGPGAADAVKATLAAPASGSIFRGVALTPKVPTTPSFATGPADTSGSYGSTVSFGPVSATGPGCPTYSWKHGSTVLSDGASGTGSTISGSSSATLSISGITAGDSGSYYAVASNNGGSTVSSPATLTLAGSCITTQLASRTNVAGTTASFTVAHACPGSISYAWTYNSSPIGDGTGPSGFSTISGSSGPTLTIANVQDGDAGDYSVTITDSDPNPSSSTATLTVVDPPSFSSQPVSLNKAAGLNATFSVTATGGALAYQWYKNAGAINDGASGTGSTRSGTHTASLTITSVQDGDAGTYTVIATNLAGSTGSSDPATLTVGHPPAFTSAPANTNVWVGSNAVFKAVVSGTATISYTWKHNNTTINNDGIHIFGADTDTLTLVGVQTSDALSYTVSANNAYGSANTIALLSVITADPKPNTVAGQILYDPFDYPTGPFPASVAYSWDHIISVYNQLTGEPAYWYNAAGTLNAAVLANDLVNWSGTSQVGPGQYPWPGIDCNSVNMWYWSSAPNNNHLRFGGVDQTNGAAYFSCIFHVHQGSTLSQGTFDVIAGMLSGTAVDGWNYKLCTQVSSGGDSYNLGVFKGGGTTINAGSVNGQWVSSKTLFRGQPHLLVGCYKFGHGTNLVSGSLTNDDIVSLWIDPDRSTFGVAEGSVPTPDAGGMVTNWGVNAPITEFGMRGTVAPASKRMTDLRIGKTWASVTQPYYPTLKITATSTDVTVAFPAKDSPYDPANGVYHGYLLQESPDFASWSNVYPPYTLDGSGKTNSITESLGSHQFYRMVEPPR